jgi:cytosine/adenosine deaminase-related metal-dependent hydrolase
VVFHELLGFKEMDGALIERTREARSAAGPPTVSLAPHAPYSTSPELFRAIRAAVDQSDCGVMSVHLGESPEESEFLASGTGPWRGMLEFIGVWRDDWQVPSCGPVAYLDRLGVIDARTLVVHGVQFDRDDLAALGAIGVTLVSCPRSNTHVGAGEPPLDAFYREGVRVAFGTDSLASVADLNLFTELAEARRVAPDVSAARLLESATRIGAEALGSGEEFGTLEAGKRAALLGVRIPDVPDVEEYLVSGVPRDAIRWLA